ncbi:insulin receptor substrate 1-like [Lethenteron reissneri]|uniref:insulin receptor substrate 1-like n=1 Tax=Lethenteron reissneri TaxID=7753 RepID=UPI002AB6F32A|nr:insulin receptor substrate 1-like [Lethenteron reissneri]
MATTTTTAAAADDVLHSGYLRKQKSSHRRFFVLRCASSSGPARLEAWDSEKRFRDSLQKRQRDSSGIVGVGTVDGGGGGVGGTAEKPRAPAGTGGAGGTGGGGSCKSSWCSPRRSLELAQCLAVSRGANARHAHLLVLFTAEHSLAVAADSDEALAAWFGAIQALRAKEPEPQGGRGDCASARDVWQVTVRARGLGAPPCGLAGVHRLCLSERSLSLVPLGASAAAVSLQLPNIRRCGHSDHYFFMEVGRSAVTGEGELWMAVDDAVVAQRMHETILGAMKALSSGGGGAGIAGADDPRTPRASSSSANAGPPSPVAPSSAGAGAGAANAGTASRRQPPAGVSRSREGDAAATAATVTVAVAASPSRRLGGGPWRRGVTATNRGGTVTTSAVTSAVTSALTAAAALPPVRSVSGSLSDGGFASSSDESGSCVSPDPDGAGGELPLVVAAAGQPPSRAPIRRTASLSSAGAYAGGGGGSAGGCVDRKGGSGRGETPRWVLARASVTSLEELSPHRAASRSAAGVVAGVTATAAASISSSLGSASPKSSSSLSDQAFLDDDEDDDDEDDDDDDHDGDGVGGFRGVGCERARADDDGGYVSMQPGVAPGRQPSQPAAVAVPVPTPASTPQSDYVPMTYNNNSSDDNRDRRQRVGNNNNNGNNRHRRSCPSEPRNVTGGAGGGGRGGANAGYVLMTPSPDAAFPWPGLPPEADDDADDYMSMAPAGPGIDDDDFGGGGGGVGYNRGNNGNVAAGSPRRDRRHQQQRRRQQQQQRQHWDVGDGHDGPYCYYSLPRSLRPVGPGLHRTASLHTQQQQQVPPPPARGLTAQPVPSAGAGVTQPPAGHDASAQPGPGTRAGLHIQFRRSSSSGGGGGGGVQPAFDVQPGRNTPFRPGRRCLTPVSPRRSPGPPSPVGFIPRSQSSQDLGRPGRGTVPGGPGGEGGGPATRGGVGGPSGRRIGRGGEEEEEEVERLGGDYVRIHYEAAPKPPGPTGPPVGRGPAGWRGAAPLLGGGGGADAAGGPDYTEMELPAGGADGEGRGALHYAALDLGEEGPPGGGPLGGDGGADYASIDFRARGEKGPRGRCGGGGMGGTV